MADETDPEAFDFDSMANEILEAYVRRLRSQVTNAPPEDILTLAKAGPALINTLSELQEAWWVVGEVEVDPDR